MKNNQTLAVEYIQSGAKIKQRIVELQALLKQTKSETDIFHLNRRIKLLQHEYYDCVKIARHLRGSGPHTTLDGAIWPPQKDVYKPLKKPKFYS